MFVRLILSPSGLGSKGRANDGSLVADGMVRILGRFLGFDVWGRVGLLYLPLLRF